MKKRTLGIGLLLSGFALTLGAFLIPSNKVEEAKGYTASSLPTTIDLNDTSAANIRSYYSSLNSLATNQRQGTNLLKNLKTILKNGQKYYSYENGTSIWQMYEITDRDWDKSPASSTTYGTYNSSTNKITNYTYGTSSSSSKNNPYIHALYINRDVNNQTTAWDNHNQDQWGINREHVWPKAEGFDTSGAGGARGDPMHLMAGNGYANNIHSNYYYGYVKTSASYTDCGSKYSNQSGNLRGTSKTLNSGTVFEPQDCDKGDIARSIFYMVARYNYLSGSDSDGIDTNNPNLTLTQNISDWSSSGYTSSTSTQGKLGVLTDLLAWHHADPVDEYEIHRNNLLYTNFTNNRNPFIDFPEWADFIWGTASYNGTTYQSYDSTPTGYATPSSDTINGYNSGSSDPVSVTGVALNKNSTSVEVGGSEVLSATISPSNATNRAVSWTSSNTNVATVSSSGRVEGVAEGNATITVTTSDGNKTATCSVTVTAASGGGEIVSDTISFSKSGSTDTVTTGYSLVVTNGKADNTNGFYYDKSSTVGLDLDLKKDSGRIWTTSPTSLSLTVTVGGGSTKDPLTNSVIAYFLDSNGDVIDGSSKVVTTKVEEKTGTAYTVTMPSANNVSGIRIHHDKESSYNVRIYGFSLTYGSEASTKALSSITLDTSDAPTTFNVGDTFSYEGLVVTAHYDDGSDGIVVPTSVSTPSLASSGQKTVTVTYEENDVTKTATYTITVNAVTLTSIEVSGATTSYFVGESFVKPTVTANYSNGSTSNVTNEATFTGYNMSNAGNQTVTVSYTNGTTVTTTFNITVTAVAVSSLEISGYTTSFHIGDTFTFGGTVVAHYNNGTSSTVTSSATYSGYDMNTSGQQTVTVSYGGASTTYSITISNSSAATDTTQYSLINSTSDLEAGKSYIITNGTSGTVSAMSTVSNDYNRKVTSAVISNGLITRGSSILSVTLGGSSDAWTFATENYGGTAGYLASGTASQSYNNLRVLTTAGTATISFNDDAATINVGPHETRSLICYNSALNSNEGGFACYSTQGTLGSVYLWKEIEPKALSSISLDTANVKTSFSVGETFEYSGLVVTAHYSNASDEIVTPTSVSTPDLSAVGQKAVTVSYTINGVTKTSSYNINVTSNPVISWTAPTIDVYSGSVLSGSEVNSWAVAYNDGAGHISNPTYSQLTVKLDGTAISIPHTWAASDDGKALTVTYNCLTTSASDAVVVTQSINNVIASTATTNVSTLNFTEKYSTGGATADNGIVWTVESDAASGESNFDTNKGIHYGTGTATTGVVSYITLSTSQISSGKITKVEIDASTASGVSATVGVTVSGSQFGGEAQSITSSAVPNNPYTFTGNADAGAIVVTIAKPSSEVKALYCKSIVVTYVTTSAESNIANSVSHKAAQRVAVKFAKAFNAAMDTTSNCTENMSTAWSTCSTAYNTFKSEAAALGTDEEAYAKNLIKFAVAQYSDDSGEACIERMLKTYEVCVQKHSMNPFMNDLITLGRAPASVTPLEVTTDTTVIIIISVVGVAALGGYLFIRRYKQK